jgi:hypothetical protein
MSTTITAALQSPVNPGGYQEQVGAYLNQQETLFGGLSKQDADSVQQFMLNTFNESTVSGSALTSTTAGSR